MSKLPCANTMIFKKYPPLKSGPPEISVIQREFRRNEGSTDYATIPEVTLAGDFVIEFEEYISPFSGSYVLIGNSLETNSFVLIQGGGKVRFKDSAANFTDSADGVINFDQLNHIKIAKVGSSVFIYVNGTQVASGTSNASLIVDLLYKNASGFHLAGILANLKIYDNGTLIRDYPINDGKNILANAATALGSELDGLTYALTTAIGGVASVVLSSLSVIGKTYLVEVSYSGVVGDASVRIGGFSSPSFTGTGTIEFVATATTTVNDILGALTGVTSGSVTVSIKEAVGYGTIINGNADDWGLFDRQADGDWLGQELVVNGGFDSDLIGWTVTGADATHTVNWEAGSARYVSDTTSPQLLFKQDNVSVSGLLYRLGIDLTVNSGGVKTTTGFASPENLLANGLNTLDATANGSTLGLTRATSSTDVNINNVSVKEVLKNA